MTFANNEGVSTSVTHLHDGYDVIYDVFVSFRGEDTRYNFTDRLYQALNDKGLTPFIDDDDLTRGEKISDAVYKGCKSSRTSIIILSTNYAASRWCLDELAMILKFRENDHLVLPVFYGVNPSEVRKQEGNFGSTFIKFSERFDKERVQTWKTALTEVANLSGWQLEAGYESKCLDYFFFFFFNLIFFYNWQMVNYEKKEIIGLGKEGNNNFFLIIFLYLS